MGNRSRLIFYSYAESSGNMLFTTKGTKDPKREAQYVLTFLRDFRVRGEMAYDQI